MLHTVGPETKLEDEQKIGRAYQTWLAPILLVGPIVAVMFIEFEYVIAGCFGLALLLLHEAGGRLHDLCIRLRRTNILVDNSE